MRRQPRNTHSESSSSEEDKQFKITANPPQPRKVSKEDNYDSSQQNISSLSEQSQEQSERKYNKVFANKQTIQHGSQSHSSGSEKSSGIDMIEQRIRKLQNDLEDKIDKQKYNQLLRKEEKPKETQVIRSYVNPPLPAKKGQPTKQIMTKQLVNVKTANPTSSQNRNNTNISANSRQNENKLKETVKRKEDGSQQTKPNLQSKSPKRQITIKPAERMPSPQSLQKQRELSRNHQNEITNTNLLKQAQLQITSLHQIIAQLKKQNLQLKDQLQKKQHKKRAHELEVLKMGADSDDMKLQKQIQTLKALQSLQKKLTRSINKKQKAKQAKNLSNMQSNARKA